MPERGGYLTIAMVSFSISAVSSFTVLLTALTFASLRNKLFMRIICMISGSDLISALINFYYNLATYSEGSNCEVMGVLTTIFYSSSIVWTVILVFLLKGITCEKKVLLSFWQMIIIGWGIPLLRALLPLSTSTYRRIEYFCEISSLQNNRIDTPAKCWQTIMNVCFLFVCVTLLLYWRFDVGRKLQNKLISMSPLVMLTIRSMELYSFAITFSWVLRLIFEINDVGNNSLFEEDYDINVICIFFENLHGAVLTLIFFYLSKEARNKWWELFSKIYLILHKKPSKDPIEITNGLFGKETDFQIQSFQERDTTSFTGNQSRPDGDTFISSSPPSRPSSSSLSNTTLTPTDISWNSLTGDSLSSLKTIDVIGLDFNDISMHDAIIPKNNLTVRHASALSMRLVTNINRFSTNRRFSVRNLAPVNPIQQSSAEKTSHMQSNEKTINTGESSEVEMAAKLSFEKT